MSIVQSLLWVVLPYSSLAIFIMGLIWQYDSRETYENKALKASFLLLSIIALGTGLYSVFSLNTHISVMEWIINLLLLEPSIKLLEATPFLFKMHLISLCTLLIFLPFTKYVKLVNLLLSKKMVAVPILVLLIGI